MSRLTTPKTERKREMICRYEDCDVCEEYCPHLNEDNCQCLQEVLEKLADYEDKEEQGLLLELKVPLDTRIWYLEEDYHDNTVEIATTFYDFRWLYCHKDEEFYLTRSEAEEALAKMGGK